MRLPPTCAVQESPDRKLSCSRFKPIHLTTRYVDGKYPASFFLHRMDTKAMPHIDGHRPKNSPEDESAAHQDVQGDPVGDKRRVPGKVDARRELVAERQDHREIRVEVDEVPGLVREVASCHGDRNHDDCNQESE